MFFWLVFIWSSQILFLFYHADRFKGETWLEILFAFPASFKLNISTAMYLTGLYWLSSTLVALTGARAIGKASDGLLKVLIILCSLAVTADLELYRQWNSKLSTKVFQYFKQPGEIYSSLPDETFWGLILIWILWSVIFLKIFNRFHKVTAENRTMRPIHILAMLLTGGLMVVVMRGGFQQIPINQSDAYYSKNPSLNAAAVNPVWNLVFTLEQNAKMLNRNPFIFMDKQKAQAVVHELFKNPEGPSRVILKTNKPNIVLIILEGVSADMMATLGGYSETAPNLDKVASEGLLFTRCYSSGDRSEQGMAAILSGFPAQPITSVLRQPDKFHRLPSLISTLGKAGYETSFYFGGQLSYGNIRAYLMFNQIKRMVELKDFGKEAFRGKLGVHDGDLFNRFLTESSNWKNPFFSTLFTLSSHTPYDIPARHKIFGFGEHENGYCNGVQYSDSCLGAFMEGARSMPWYQNTLFIFISDHSHETPKGNDFFSLAHRRIPLIVAGPVLLDSLKGKIFDSIVSQSDIPSTLLSQLNLEKSAFSWSRDVLHPEYQPFAFMSFLEGSHGFAEKNHYYVYNTAQHRYFIKNLPEGKAKDSLIEKGNAILQVMFDEYLSY